MTSDELACCVDALFTDMGPTKSQFDSYCLKVEQLALRALVLPPRLVTSAGRRLGATSTKIVALVGYPFGAYPLKAKLSDAEETVKRGAGSLEFVLNPDALETPITKSWKADYVALPGFSRGQRSGSLLRRGTFRPMLGAPFAGLPVRMGSPMWFAQRDSEGVARSRQSSLRA